MNAKRLGALVLGMACGLAAVAVATPRGAGHGGAIDSTAVSGPASPASLSAALTSPPPESPQLAPRPAEEHCVACELAERTTGSLPPGSFTLVPEAAPDGALLRITSRDPHVRATLWQAMLARGALLEALREGTALPLCASCAARRTLASQVEIRARRTADGLTLAYASKNPLVVERLHALVRGTPSGPVQF